MEKEWEVKKEMGKEKEGEVLIGMGMKKEMGSGNWNGKGMKKGNGIEVGGEDDIKG